MSPRDGALHVRPISGMLFEIRPCSDRRSMPGSSGMWAQTVSPSPSPSPGRSTVCTVALQYLLWQLSSCGNAQ
jgi:hypothetical protein